MSKEQFKGVWKFIGFEDKRTFTTKTHIVINENHFWEVHPKSVYYEGEDGPEQEYKLEETEATGIFKFSSSKGYKYLLKIENNILYMKLGDVFGYFPENFEDRGMLSKYELENSKQALKLSQLPQKIKREHYTVENLGTFQYQDKSKYWAGSILFLGQTINLEIVHNDEEKYSCFALLAEKIKEMQAVNLYQIASNNLLTTYNESWKEDDWENEPEEDESLDEDLEYEAPDLTAEEFEARLSLQSICIERDGSCSVFLNDGDLFAGHLINISMDRNCEIENVAIFG
ncbi:MAG: DUF2262 domain-containing protein [Marinifilaceae bacterium]|jgi:hypothetical protein|nr:DUF2262 domain-containing protein [Marinifilaceae bacterium]